MLIIGCDYHPSVQQIAWVDRETGECGEQRLRHRAEAESFYHDWKGKQVRVEIEATGHSRWFERFLAELKVELWIGDPAQIRAKRVRKQRNDRFAPTASLPPLPLRLLPGGANQFPGSFTH